MRSLSAWMSKLHLGWVGWRDSKFSIKWSTWTMFKLWHWLLAMVKIVALWISSAESNCSHVGHGSSVYITTNPAAFAHSWPFLWLCMWLHVVWVWLLWNITTGLAACEDKQALKLIVLQANVQWSGSIIVKVQGTQLKCSKCRLL